MYWHEFYVYSIIMLKIEPDGLAAKRKSVTGVSNYNIFYGENFRYSNFSGYKTWTMCLQKEHS